MLIALLSRANSDTFEVTNWCKAMFDTSSEGGKGGVTSYAF